MKLNWNFISKIFARTVGVENLSRDAEGHEVLSADQRKILEQKFGPEALQHYDAYAASDANDDAQQEQLLLNFLDAIGRSGGDDKDKLRQELAKADDRIIFTGFVQGQLLDELYSNAYIYTLPSDLEGMPLSLLEAMSYGNCCVVSDASF